MANHADSKQAPLQSGGQTHLKWSDVIVIGPSFDGHSEQKKKLIEQLEKIEKTQTGQALLKAITEKPGEQRPLTLTYNASEDLPPFAVYDSYTHSVEVKRSFFDEGFEAMVGRNRAQYLVHELGHAADFIDGTFTQTKLENKAAFLFLAGEEEAKAERWVKRYDEENGLTHSDYINPKSTDILTKLLPFQKEFVAQQIAKGIITQGTIDGHPAKEVLESLNKTLAEIKKTHGIDISKEVSSYLNGPPPEFDETGQEKVQASPAAPKMEQNEAGTTASSHTSQQKATIPASAGMLPN